MEMNGITLFIFGGVAEMGDEPPSAGTEFWMAVVGPFSSLLLGLAFRLGAIAAQDASVPVAAVLRQLSFMNILLAIFNLLPGFPLDGGRILRAALWGWRKSLRWATRVASRVGSIFGILLMILGVGVTLWFRDFMGIWWLLIGMFLHNAAQMSYRQVIVRQALEGEPVLRFMQQDPVTVAPETTIDRLVDDYVYRHMYKMYPVVEPGGELRGCINTRQVKELPREEWPVRHVSELMEPCSNKNSVSPYTDALRALTLMNRGRKSRLLVVDGGRLVGVLALKDLLRFLSLKIDLEEGGKDAVQQGTA
jgi:CBS domain-containing protein